MWLRMTARSPESPKIIQKTGKMLLNYQERFDYTVWADGKECKGYIQPEPDLLENGLPFRFQVYLLKHDGLYYQGSLNILWGKDKLQNATQEFSDAIREYIMLRYE